MNLRLHAVVTFSKRRIFETFISPALYVVTTVGLLLGYVLVSGFIAAVDSSGLNYANSPLYELVARSLSGIFGQAFVIKLFSDGPFLFSCYVTFTPFLLYLAISSVYRFGFEKNVGALELLMYGPADETACLLSFAVRNMLYTVLFGAVLLLFFSLAALLSNMALGASFFYGLLMALLLSLTVFAYGTLASALAGNGSAGTALLAGVVVFFVLIQMGSFTIQTGYVRSLSTVLASVVKWVSPVYHWSQGLSSISAGNVGGLLGSIGMSILLAVVLLFVSHVIMRARGIRE